MTDLFRWVLIGVGTLTIAGGLAAYFKDTSRWAPAIFVAFGVALCGVANIKMSFGAQGGTLEIGQELASASQANQDLAKTQSATVDALGARLDQLAGAVATLQGAVNTKLAQASAPPVAVPQLDALNASEAKFRATLSANSTANLRAFDANRKLQAAIERSKGP